MGRIVLSYGGHTAGVHPRITACRNRDKETTSLRHPRKVYA
jgi:hypothetical protein